MGEGTQTALPKLSGPHICFGVGRQTLHYAKQILISAADHKGSGLTADEISFVLDMAESSEGIFEVFRSNYELCGKVHKKQPFIAANETFFATSVLRFLCFDIVRTVFQPQIRYSDSNWEVTFLGGLGQYINDSMDCEFIRDLAARYKDLAREHGMNLDVLMIARDDEVIRKVRGVVSNLPSDEKDVEQLVKIVNNVLSEKYNAYGATPIKISGPVANKFIEELKVKETSNVFRKSIFLEN